MLEKAYKGNYDYYHVISNADLPLKNNTDFDLFFEKNKGFQFIQYDDEALNNNPEIRRRTRLYHFLQNYRRRYKEKWKNNFFTLCERILLVIQIVLRVNRVKDLDWTIKYGSNWVSITGDLVVELLSQKDKIEKVFSYTNCSDELFVQTVAYNFGFQNRIYVPKAGQNQNMRYVDWKRGKNGNPYTFRSEDYEVIKESSALFARKFSETVDKEIIIKILESRG